MTLMVTALLFLVSKPFVKKINKMSNGIDTLCMCFFQSAFNTSYFYSVFLSEYTISEQDKTELMQKLYERLHMCSYYQLIHVYIDFIFKLQAFILILIY